MFHRILDTVWGQASNLLTTPLRWRRLLDVLVLAAFVGLLTGVVFVAREWTVINRPVVEINLSPWALPKYALLSFVRAAAAYALSLAFTLVFAYWAARDPLAERILIPILDILQSIPLLAFMPVVLLAMVSIFPRSNIGLELSAIILIVTCQAWNMAFSFYQSLKTLPDDLDEASRSMGLTWYQRLRKVELPFATPGLVWNSMVSVANGWFFLMVAEAFRLGDRDFRLPGVGAYMSVAVDQGNIPAQIYCILAMILLVLILDQMLWKPVVAWSQRFQVDDQAQMEKPRSWLLRLLRRSVILRRFRLSFSSRMPARRPQATPAADVPQQSRRLQRILALGLISLVLAFLATIGFKLVEILANVSLREWKHLFQAGGISMGRVLLSSMLATCWTLPVGLWIGLNPALSRRLQPWVQVVASFPSSLLFAALILWLRNKGIGLGFSSILLMALSTQWYLLFNIIAGAQAVPLNLQEAGHAFRLSLWDRARTLYFPAIFPYLVTGWVTATGGAWNASIVTEFVTAKGMNFHTLGLGAEVTLATNDNNIPMLAASALLMATLVVVFNRLVWAPLYRLAATRYSLNR